MDFNYRKIKLGRIVFIKDLSEMCNVATLVTYIKQVLKPDKFGALDSMVLKTVEIWDNRLINCSWLFMLCKCVKVCLTCIGMSA